MALNLARKLIAAHCVDGLPPTDHEVSLQVDQVLLQDVLGTLVTLELEALGIDRVRTALAVQYVDHNLLQNDNLNAEEHPLLQSAHERFGIWYSRPVNGISHPVHMQRFGVPGASLAGSDSHTPAANALGILAIGIGGMEVALALAGHSLHIPMPAIWGIRLTGHLPQWVSTKDVILELLRRHGVKGGVGRVIEHNGNGLECLSAMGRHVIANMGAELGATSAAFPSDGEVLHFMSEQGRSSDWRELRADPGATYDFEDAVDLGGVEPMIANPSSPGNVVPVREVAGLEIAQAYIGSSANPGYRDFAVAAHIMQGRRVHAGVSFDIHPRTRQMLESLVASGALGELIHAGARLHQTGCNGCIGMGQIPATGRRSLRTVPRNFPGRSGTREDSVYLCSPETAAASAIAGRVTDPCTLGLAVTPSPAHRLAVDDKMIMPPLAPEDASRTTLRNTANITSLPRLDPIPDELRLPILLCLGDNVSTDEIMPAGGASAAVLEQHRAVQRSRVQGGRPRPCQTDTRVPRERPCDRRRAELRSRVEPGERRSGIAACRPAYGVGAGFLAYLSAEPRRFRCPAAGVRRAGGPRARLAGGVLTFNGLHEAIRAAQLIEAELEGGQPVLLRHDLSERQAETMPEGGMTNWVRKSVRTPGLAPALQGWHA